MHELFVFQHGQILERLQRYSVQPFLFHQLGLITDFYKPSVVLKLVSVGFIGECTSDHLQFRN
jgi:hypothetical protein